MKKEKVVKYFKIGLIITLLVLFAGGFLDFYHKHLESIDETDYFLQISTSLEKQDTIDFAEIIPGEWDSLLVVRSYADYSGLEKKYNIKHLHSVTTSIDYSGGGIKLIFCKGRKVESFYDLSSDFDITGIDDDEITSNGGKKFDRGDVRFKIVESNEWGAPILEHISNQ